MRIVNAGKSKYYHAALDNIEQAKKCYARAELEADWEAVAADIRERHYRKKGFMVGFDAILSNARKQVEPTFLERAKTRWPRNTEILHRGGKKGSVAYGDPISNYIDGSYINSMKLLIFSKDFGFKF